MQLEINISSSLQTFIIEPYVCRINNNFFIMQTRANKALQSFLALQTPEKSTEKCEVGERVKAQKQE